MSAEALPATSEPWTPPTLFQLELAISRALTDEYGDRVPPICESAPFLWFPNVGDPGDSAKDACMRCPAQRECLMYAAIAGEDRGIWGGVAHPGRGSMDRRLDLLALHGLIP